MYSLLDVADGLAYRTAEQLDPDPERAADLHRALLSLHPETARALELWASGYTLRETSEVLWGKNSPNRAKGLVQDGLREVRGRMNADGEQTSK